jgi:ureidoacrylate peracid hydrolase
MHQLDLDPAVVQRARARRGGDYAFANIDPHKTALLAIDLQNWLLDPSSPTYVPHSESLVEPINAVAGALRTAGGTVVWVKMEATDQSLREWPAFFDGIVAGAKDVFESALRPGTHWHGLHPQLDVRPGDLTSSKSRYSCLLECSSDLHAILGKNGIDTVLVAGVVTNVCCESTARDAMMMGYKVIVLSDGCGCRSDSEHNASLTNLLNMFADIRSCDSAIAMLERH